MSKHIFNIQLAGRTVRDYVCSACWGHLIQKHSKEGNIVECFSCVEDTKGFVTKTYANNRLSDSVGERLDVRKTLLDLGVIENPHAGKTTQELLTEMGF